MISILESICPLCSHVFASERLHQHIVTEHPRLRHSTIKVIQCYHPGWIEEHGACGPCWKSYRSAGQIINLMKNARPRHAVDSWNSVESAEEGHGNHEGSRLNAHGKGSYGNPA